MQGRTRRGAGTALLTRAERLANLLRKTAVNTPPPHFSECYDARLETWDDPTPRDSEFTVYDLHQACVRAARRSFDLAAAMKSLVSPSEEQVRQRGEQHRKFLTVALEVFTKENNMQPTELEIVEVKERNLIDESGVGYLHFNFLVKGLDDKHTMFFAEVHYDLEDEDDVFLCIPLGEDDLKPSKENDQTLCKACQHQAKDIIHPSCGRFLGGHRNVCSLMKWDNSDEESDYEFI